MSPQLNQSPIRKRSVYKIILYISITILSLMAIHFIFSEPDDENMIKDNKKVATSKTPIDQTIAPKKNGSLKPKCNPPPGKVINTFPNICEDSIKTASFNKPFEPKPSNPEPTHPTQSTSEPIQLETTINIVKTEQNNPINEPIIPIPINLENDPNPTSVVLDSSVFVAKSVGQMLWAFGDAFAKVSYSLASYGLSSSSSSKEQPIDYNSLERNFSVSVLNENAPKSSSSKDTEMNFTTDVVKSVSANESPSIPSIIPIYTEENHILSKSHSVSTQSIATIPDQSSLPAITQPVNTSVTKPSGISSTEPLQSDKTMNQHRTVINPIFFNDIDDDNSESLRRIIDQNENLSEPNSEGLNALHYAAKHLKIECLKVLLDSEVFSVDEITTDGKKMTALQLVCNQAKDGDKVKMIEAATLLLNQHADVNYGDKSDGSSLFFAVQSGNESLVEFLLKNGANPNSITSLNFTILHYAAVCASRQILKYLLDYGADMTAISYLNRMPIHDAAAAGNVDALKEFILTRGIFGVTKNILTPSKEDKKYNPKFSYDCMFKAAPIHFAVRYNKIEAVEFLALIRANLRMADGDGVFTQGIAKRYTGHTSEMTFYIEGQILWEYGEPDMGSAENYVRHCDTLPPDSQESLYQTLKRNNLHKLLNK